ncbi:hypothetical protein AHAS_Ahas07G0119600 [Arachis hypogaea]
MQEAVKGEFWRLRDDQGKPSSVMGWSLVLWLSCCGLGKECLGKQCVNNSKVFDVTFLVEGGYIAAKLFFIYFSFLKFLVDFCLCTDLPYFPSTEKRFYAHRVCLVK